MIAAVVGLLTLLCALVTGLMIWTAYGVYAGQNTQIQALASKVMQLDLRAVRLWAGANHRARPASGRVGEDHDQVWGGSESDSNFAANSFAEAI